MPECPRCFENIDTLEFQCHGVTYGTARYHEDVPILLHEDEWTEEYTHYCCPSCGAMLFGDEILARQFLKGGDNDD